MAMQDSRPQPDDWVVDIEVDGERTNNRLWGQADELAGLLLDNVEILGGTTSLTDICELIAQLNTLETDNRRQYVVVQRPQLSKS